MGMETLSFPYPTVHHKPNLEFSTEKQPSMMLSLRPRLLKKSRSRKRGDWAAKKIGTASLTAASPVQRRRRYFLRSMASAQNNGDASSGITPNTGPSEFRCPRYPLPPNRAKRSWSDEEDALLIEILLELHHTGRYKADQGFKPGIYSAAEKELERRKPGCGICADPHIYSRVKTLKSHYNIVYDMLNGNSSGFGWDDTRMCVTAEDEVWASYLQSHKSAAQFRGKTFIHYDELSVLFGVDRAAGGGATSHRQTNVNVLAGTDNVNPDHGSDNMASQSVADIGSPTGSNSTMSAGRKRKASADVEVLAETIERTSDRMESSIITVGKQICDALSNVTLATKREQMLQQLLDMPELTQAQLIATHQHLNDRPTDIDLFFRLSPEAHLSWIQRLPRV